MKLFHYTSFGLHIASEIECCELLPNAATAEDDASIDVRIHYGEVPESLPDANWQDAYFQTKPEQCLLVLNHIARYLVRNGNEIIIARAEEGSDCQVRLYLLGSCLGALLHERGILAMHASTISTERGAVLFTGPSGIGKSTLLGALLKRGYSMLADDITGIAINGDGQPLVLSGYPQVKLWAAAARKLDRPTGELRRVHPEMEKFALPMTAQFATEPMPLRSVYALARHHHKDITFEPVRNIDKFDIFVNNTYRHHFLDGLGLRPSHFKLAAAAAKTAKVTRIRRPDDSFLLDELADRIVEELTERMPKRN